MIIFASCDEAYDRNHVQKSLGSEVSVTMLLEGRLIHDTVEAEQAGRAGRSAGRRAPSPFLIHAALQTVMLQHLRSGTFPLGLGILISGNAMKHSEGYFPSPLLTTKSGQWAMKCRYHNTYIL